MPRPQCEDVRALRLELLVGHLDHADAALGEELEQSHRRDPRVDEREVTVERRDERHEVHHLTAAVPVGEVEGDDVDVRKRVRQGRDRGRVRPVADADEERALVEPDGIAALGAHRVCELGSHGHVGRRERRRDRGRLASPLLLAGPEEHSAPRADQHRVVDVDRVWIARVVPGDHDLGAGRLEDPAQQLVLGSRSSMIRSRVPAVLAPALGVLGERRPHEHALETTGHRLRAEAGHARDATPRSAACVPRAGRRAARTRRASPSRGGSRGSRSRCAA